jgi:nitrogen fixation protein FixH
MTDSLLLSLGLGLAAIVLVNLGLVRFTGTSARQAAATVALVTIGLYGPYSILNWPGGDVFAIHLAIYLLGSLACGMLLDARASGCGLHWGPATIGGFFIIVATVCATLVSVAQHGLTPMIGRWVLPEAASGRVVVSSMFPGVVSHDFHKKESLHNQYLQQFEHQRERGWQVRQGWLDDPVADRPTAFRVAAQTRDGKPLAGAAVTGEFLRPANSHLDIAFDLAERAPGVYETELQLPAAGLWNMVLNIRQGEESHEVRANTRVLEP